MAIVVIARSPACGLPLCLEALIDQRHAPLSYEILVVNDGSPEVRRCVRRYAHGGSGEPAVVLVEPPSPRSGEAHARNVGWRSTSAEIVAFTRGECIPAGDWLARGLEAMPLGVSAAWGPVHAAADSPRAMSAANCFVRRSVLERTGGFDERFGQRGGGDDLDLYLSMQDAGLRIVHVPTARVLAVGSPRRPRSRTHARADARPRFQALRQAWMLARKHPDVSPEGLCALSPNGDERRARLRAALVTFLARRKVPERWRLRRRTRRGGSAAPARDDGAGCDPGYPDAGAGHADAGHADPGRTSAGGLDHAGHAHAGHDHAENDSAGHDGTGHDSTGHDNPGRDDGPPDRGGHA